MIKRLVTLWKRKQQAKRLGFHFKRAADFAPPAEIQVGAKRIGLSLPDDRGTLTAFIDVLLDDCYHLSELPNDIHKILDIGCHVGLFSVAARNRWPQAVIQAYEPNPSLKQHWKHHAMQAGFTVYDEAVGMTSGSVALSNDDDSVQVRTIETGDGAINQIAFCDALTRLGGNADLVKLDCEGAEWLILQDEKSWLKVRFLTMEFHLWAGYSLEELKTRLNSLGFQIHRLVMTGTDFGLLLAGRKSNLSV